MKTIAFIILVIPTLANAIGVKVFTNHEIKKQYDIRIELAEKSLRECNDFVIFAPLEIKEVDLGELTLENVETSVYESEPGINAVLDVSEHKVMDITQIESVGRVLGCVPKNEVTKTYFKFIYIKPGAPSLILLAPLM